MGEFLPLPQPTHYGDLQSHTWFSLDDGWSHDEADTDIPAPLHATPDLVDHIKAVVERRGLSRWSVFETTLS